MESSEYEDAKLAEVKKAKFKERQKNHEPPVVKEEVKSIESLTSLDPSCEYTQSIESTESRKKRRTRKDRSHRPSARMSIHVEDEPVP